MTTTTRAHTWRPLNLILGFAVLALAVVGLRLGVARADSCTEREPLSEQDVDRAIMRIDELGVKRLLASLEPMDRCDDLRRIAEKLRPEYNHHKRMLAAILLVTTVGRDPTRARAAHLARASQLIDELMYEHERRELMGYVLDKLSVVPDNEPLYAFLDGPTPTGVVGTLDKLVAGTPSGRVDPAPWAPPGKQAIPFYIGNHAHAMIAKYYRNANRRHRIELNHTPIASILRLLAEDGIGPSKNLQAAAVGPLALRPDIANLSTQEIYEIKPAGLASKAAALVAAYRATFESAGVTMWPGRSNAPGTSGVIPAPAGHFRFWSPSAGVIVYRYHRGAYVSAVEQRAKEPTAMHVPVAESRSSASASGSGGFWDDMSDATGLSGTALVLYVILSEGSRIIPLRNAIPAP